MIATGTASIGISVARQLWRKMKTTRVTSTMASNSVFTTSSIEAVMNGVVSNGMDQVTPAGKAPGQLVHPRVDRLLHVERVGAGPQVQQDGGGRAGR